MITELALKNNSLLTNNNKLVLKVKIKIKIQLKIYKKN